MFIGFISNPYGEEFSGIGNSPDEVVEILEGKIGDLINHSDIDFYRAEPVKVTREVIFRVEDC